MNLRRPELEDAPFTLEEITEVNAPRFVLEKYGTLRIDEQMMNADGEPFGFSHFQFSLTEDGQVLSNVHLQEGDIEVFSNFSVADDMPGSMFWSGNNGQVLYCMPYDPEFDETVSEGGAASFCALTLVINPGQDNEETQQHNVALGLEVQFTALEGENVAIYADEAMTQAVDAIDTSAESATYYISVG